MDFNPDACLDVSQVEDCRGDHCYRWEETGRTPPNGCPEVREIDMGPAPRPDKSDDA
jgi:hypothetical protein